MPIYDRKRERDDSNRSNATEKKAKKEIKSKKKKNRTCVGITFRSIYQRQAIAASGQKKLPPIQKRRPAGISFFIPRTRKRKNVKYVLFHIPPPPFKLLRKVEKRRLLLSPGEWTTPLSSASSVASNPTQRPFIRCETEHMAIIFSAGIIFRAKNKSGARDEKKIK